MNNLIKFKFFFQLQWSAMKHLVPSCTNRVRRALLLFKDVLLRTRRALLLYKVYGDSALLVLKGTSLNCNNSLLAVN